MMRAVIDTNVILVANGSHADMGEDCRAACVDRLASIAHNGCVVIDDGFEILGEYLRKTEPRQGKRAGDVFLKWLLNHQHNPKRVERVRISPTAGQSYAELDALALQIRIDPSDRKFVATAVQPRRKAPIWQAADSKWLDWWQALQGAGIAVDFICPADLVRHYQRKFPRRAEPKLP